MMKLVTDLPLQDVHLLRVQAALGTAEIVKIDRETDLSGALQDAQIALLTNRVRADDLIGHPSLKWVHVDSSGLDWLANPFLIENGPAITGSAGRSAPALAEHVLLFMLSFAYQLPKLLKAQSAGHWANPDFQHLKSLLGQTVGIIGMGETGREVAIKSRALGIKTIGFSRSDKNAAHVDIFLCQKDDGALTKLLETSDFIVLCAPLTDETHHMINAQTLSQMRSNAVLINIARGQLVDETALVNSLEANEIAGAGLDVFEQEPLGKGNPLWNAPNTIITPHITASLPDRFDRSLDIFIENAIRFRQNQPLLNQLSQADLYHPAP